MILPWRPLKWKPVYDLMVTLHIQGYTNREIAEIVGYTAVQVGNVLRAPETKAKIDLLTKQLHGRVLENNEDQLSVIKNQAIKHISTVMADETLAIKRPFETARLSADLLKGLGTFKGGGTDVTINQQNNTQHVHGITGEQIDRLSLALELSAQANKLHGGGEPKQLSSGNEDKP